MIKLEEQALFDGLGLSILTYEALIPGRKIKLVTVPFYIFSI